MGIEEAETPTGSKETEIPMGSEEAEIPKWYQSINISSLPHCKNVTDLLVHIITQPKYVKNLKDKSTRKKDIWENIAKEMKKYGYPLSLESDSIAANKCSQKLRNLKKWYNRLLHIHKCDENDLPECLAKLREVFGWGLDVVGSSMDSGVTFLEADDTIQVDPKDLIETINLEKSQGIIILKPDRKGGFSSFVYPV